jgi:outer membrane protein assembly factor BamB
MLGMMWAPLVAVVALLAWWLFASRLRWTDRILGVGVALAAGAAAFALRDPSIDMMGTIIFALPRVVTAWVLWLLVSVFLPWPVRRLGLVVVLALVWGYMALLRFDGVYGSFSAQLAWRWTPTPEQVFLAENAARAHTAPANQAGGALMLATGDWPEFRGPNRDGHCPGVRIAADWKEHRPRQVWRHRVGPGWSSFAVVGSHLYTQEQRGKNEAVVCYDAGTGEELWAHDDATRFTEVIGGPGPRATPTFAEGKLYSLGANGTLNCLNPATGEVVWSRDIVADSGAKIPQWGFASSPLVRQGIVMVYAGAPGGKSVLGYRVANGELAWSAGEGEFSYCSPHPARLDGTDQVLIATEAGLTAFAPATGAVLWTHEWALGPGMARIIQPALLGEEDLLFGGGLDIGVRRVHLAHSGDGWTSKEIWTKSTMKPYFNDLVVYKGNAFGFDGNFLACINLEDGKRMWKARGYGNGQLLLLVDQGLLLVLAETGEVALVEASPERQHELCRFPALEGKTWNHPVVVHGRLFVRNGEEAACYDLMPEVSNATASR